MSDTVPIKHPIGLTSGDFAEADEPLRLFSAWMEEATSREPADPNAMALATVDADGMPDVRMVLLKGADERGFVFYSNTESPKGRELDENPKAALVFHWKSLSRQVRVRGPVEPVSPARPTNISPAGQNFPRSARGRASNRRRWKAGWRSKKPSRSTRQNMRLARCRGRRTGRDIESCRSRSNSGRTGRSGCTIALSFGVKN